MFDNIKISCFKNAFDTTPVEVSLSQFIFSKKYIDRVEAVRAATTKEARTELKKTLPCATISGTFSKRNLQGIVSYNACVCLDFDAADNPDYTPTEIKNILASCPEILYAALSVSGAGVWAIVQTNNDTIDDHARLVELFLKVFQKIGLNIDKACKDVTRLRFISYDPDPYINEKAAIFDAQRFLTPFKEQTQPQPKPLNRDAPGVNKPSSITPGHTRNRVEKLIEKLEAGRVDITSNYYDWYRLAFSLHDEFGYDGLDYFLRVSQFNAGFIQAAATEKFEEISKKACGNIKISTFFQICKDHNITLN